MVQVCVRQILLSAAACAPLLLAGAAARAAPSVAAAPVPEQFNAGTPAAAPAAQCAGTQAQAENEENVLHRTVSVCPSPVAAKAPVGVPASPTLIASAPRGQMLTPTTTTTQTSALKASLDHTQSPQVNSTGRPAVTIAPTGPTPQSSALKQSMYHAPAGTPAPQLNPQPASRGFDDPDPEKLAQSAKTAAAIGQTAVNVIGSLLTKGKPPPSTAYAPSNASYATNGPTSKNTPGGQPATGTVRPQTNPSMGANTTAKTGKGATTAPLPTRN